MKYSNIFKQTKYTHIYTLHNIHFGDFFYQTYYNVKLLIIEHSLVAASATAAGAQGHFCIFIFKQAIYKLSAEIVRSLFCTEDFCALERLT